MNDIDAWIENFQYISLQKNSLSTNQSGGGTHMGFQPGYAALIGESISSTLDQKGANPFVKALVTVIITILAVIIVIGVIMVLLYAMVRNNLDEIRADWPNQRCSARIIPIASWVGPPGTTIGGNAKECLNDFLGKYLEKKFKPLFNLFNKIFGILGSITNSIQQVRVMIYTIRSTVMKMAEDVYKKLKDVYYRIAYLVKRVMQIIIYIFLTFRNVFMVLRYCLWTLRSITDFWLFRWCFHPLQRIPSRKDTTSHWNYDSYVSKLNVGDLINPNSIRQSKIVGIWKFKHPFATSKWVHPNKNTNWIVTPGHYVYDNEKSEWITDNTNVVLKDNAPLYCPWSAVGTIENHQGEKAMDYWGPSKIHFEHDNFMESLSKRIQEGHQLIYDNLKLRNNLLFRRWASMAMIPPNTLIKTQDGFIPIKDIKLGQVMDDNGIVNGVCEADANEFQWVQYDSLICTTGVWVKDTQSWCHAGSFGAEILKPADKCHSISTTTGNVTIKVANEIFVIKDGMGWYTIQEDATHYRALLKEL